jgi:nitrate/TMAO reductase-like tetraheme cytochrome c subunit
VGINATCQSCHNGIVATAKQVQHVTTTLDCGSCHNTMNWTLVTPRAPLKPLIPSPTKSPHPIPRDTIDRSNK